MRSSVQEHTRVDATQQLKVLVVDDNRSSADALAKLLRKQGDEVNAVYDGAAAIDRIRSDPPHVVLTDLKMEPIDGMAVLQAARGVSPPIDTIVFTAYGAVDIAVRAMHLGARDFLTKPVTVEQVASRLDEIRSGATSSDVQQVREGVRAESQASKDLTAMLQRAAGVPSAVWIEGELGSGRAFSARTLHRMGDEEQGNDTPFTIRNVAREEPWPEAGTVLLPNVDDLAEDLQRELFRQLQSLPVGVRVVATARPESRRLVAEGGLRPELFYQLAVVLISVPPLRRRVEDIELLFVEGLSMYAERYGRPLPTLPPHAMEQLERHYWPGNIRELLNLAERTVVLGPEGFNLDVIEDSGPGLPKLETGFSLASYLEGMERRILVEALRRSGGDRAAAGRLLGVERNTLRYKLNKYGLLDK
ncbi:MAG: response regulator [Myxococcales bacterium]|nr:response regulator [Myxococcales bacterium]